MGKKHHKKHRRHAAQLPTSKSPTTKQAVAKYEQAPLGHNFVDPEVKYADHPRIYVGYGSNHNVLQMQARCATAMPVGAGMMPDTRLVFAGVLTVEHVEGETCPVSLWRVKARDIAALDRYEGYPHLYGKRYTHVTVDGERQAAFYYVMNNWTESPPSGFYYQTCAEGYRDFGLPISYLEAARDRSWVVARDRREVTLYQDLRYDLDEWGTDPDVTEDDLKNWHESQTYQRRFGHNTEEA